MSSGDRAALAQVENVVTSSRHLQQAMRFPYPNGPPGSRQVRILRLTAHDLRLTWPFSLYTSAAAYSEAYAQVPSWGQTRNYPNLTTTCT